MNYTFGGNTGRSYEDLQRMRERNEQLIAPRQKKGGIHGWGEGLSTLGRAILHKKQREQIDKMQQEGEGAWNKQYNNFINPEEPRVQVFSGDPEVRKQHEEQKKQKYVQDLLQMSQSPWANKGQRSVMNMLVAKHMGVPKIIKGADGYNYNANTGERILPNVQKEPADRKIMQDANGINRYVDNEEMVFQGVQKEPSKTTAMQNYEYGLQNPEFVDYQLAGKKAGATNVDVGVGGFNVEQSKAAGFADRMINSENILSGEYGVENAGTSKRDEIFSMLPIIGNYLVTDDYRSFEQAQRDFINAVLRRESGAVITPSEFKNSEKQYFPKFGDDIETIKQKRKNRQVTIEGMIRSSGPNYRRPEYDGGSANSPNQSSANQLSDDDLIKMYGG